MSHPYKNTFLCLQEAVKQERRLLAALYSNKSCCTRSQLQQLRSRELEELIHMKMQINQISRDAALKGMEMDGVEYPLILWTEKIAPNLPDFLLKSLNQQGPLVSPGEENKKTETGNANKAKRTVIYAITAAGGVLTVIGALLSPLTMLLLCMGMILTIIGLVLLVKELCFRKKARPEREQALGSGADEEAGQIAQLLKGIFEQNCDVIYQWNGRLYEVVASVMKETEAGR